MGIFLLCGSTNPREVSKRNWKWRSSHEEAFRRDRYNRYREDTTLAVPLIHMNAYEYGFNTMTVPPRLHQNSVERYNLLTTRGMGEVSTYPPLSPSLSQSVPHLPLHCTSTIYIPALSSYVRKVLEISWERFAHIPLQWGSSTSRVLPFLGKRGFFYGLASNLHVIAFGGRLPLSLSLALKIHLSHGFVKTTFYLFFCCCYILWCVCYGDYLIT